MSSIDSLKLTTLEHNGVAIQPLQVQTGLSVKALQIIADYCASQQELQASLLILPRVFSISQEAEILLYFQHVYPNCPIYYVKSFGRALERTMGSVFSFGNVIAKYKNSSLEYVVKCASTLMALPPHKKLNRFVGIAISEDRRGFSLCFEKLEGVTLTHTRINSRKQNLQIAIDILEAYSHLEQNGIFYDDYSDANVMVTDKGQTVVIDYDYCCFKRSSDDWLMAQRWKFGLLLKMDPKLKEITEKCQSETPFESYNWTNVLHDLKKVQIASSRCSRCTIL